MSIVYVFVFIGIFIATGVRRLFGGRLRPGWSWRTEAIMRFMKWISTRHAHEDIQVIQATIGKAKPPPTPMLMKVDVTPLEVEGMRSEWIEPKGGAGDTTILYLHGGGYVLCSLDTHRDLMARLAVAANARVLGVEYRMAPAHVFPTAVDDAVSAYRWLLAQGVDPATLAIAGDSAGGGLTVATCFALREAGDPLPRACALISPWVDLVDQTGSMISNGPYDYIGGFPETHEYLASLYLAGADPKEPLASPIHGDLRGLPPLIIHAGGAEILHDQILAFAEKAREAGVEVELEVYPDMVHVWHAFSLFFPQGKDAIASIGAFLTRTMHRHEAKLAS